MDLEEFLIENELPISSMFEEQNSGGSNGGGGSGGNSGSSGTGGSNDTAQQNGCVEDDTRGQRHPSHPSQNSQNQQVMMVQLPLTQFFSLIYNCSRSRVITKYLEKEG